MKSVPVAELGALLTDAALSRGDRPVVVQAGHFVLTPHGPITRPEEGRDLPDLMAFGSFTVGTMTLGAQLLRRIIDGGGAPQLLLLVNDWQYLRTTATREERRTIERALASFRQAFLAAPAAPSMHSGALAEAGIDIESVLLRDGRSPCFSEMLLRVEVASAIARAFRSGEAFACGLSRPESDDVVVYEDEAGRRTSLVECGHASCAGEVAALVGRLKTLAVDLFINIFPETCYGPVLTGCEVGGRLYSSRPLTVLNVAIPVTSDPFENLRATVEGLTI